MIMMTTEIMIKTELIFSFYFFHQIFKEFAYSYIRVPEDVHESNNNNKNNRNNNNKKDSNN
jgi:hypothetical protein